MSQCLIHWYWIAITMLLTRYWLEYHLKKLNHWTFTLNQPYLIYPLKKKFLKFNNSALVKKILTHCIVIFFFEFIVCSIPHVLNWKFPIQNVRDDLEISRFEGNMSKFSIFCKNSNMYLKLLHLLMFSLRNCHW